MNLDDTENALPGAPRDGLCSRCGLTIGQRGSFTYWIFKEDRCQCDMPAGLSEVSKVPPLAGKESSGKHILNERYELIQCVGQGGVGFVYKGRDLTTGQLVALKIMRPELSHNELAVKRVMREVEVVSRLSNSNLGRVFGYGQEKGASPYLVMEFVEGQNLEDLLQVTGKLKLSRCIDVFMQICAGLTCAHTNGIIHRDLKPSNVIVQQGPDGQDHATIVDFGFARLLRNANDSLRLTQDGEVFGSPAYMSPEQCLGEELDHRSDIYSLGCLMYEVLVGTPPLIGENVLATVAKQIKGTPTSMRLLDPMIPESVDAIVLKCLSKEPLLRYQSVSDLRVDLDKVKKGEYVTAPKKIVQAKADKQSVDSRSLRVTEDVHRQMTSLVGLVVLLSGILICTAVGAVWYFTQKGKIEHSSPPSVHASVKDPETMPQKHVNIPDVQPVNHPSAQSDHQLHKPISVTSHMVPHHSNISHSAVRPAAAPHAAVSIHTARPTKTPSDSWDQLKGMRVHK